MSILRAVALLAVIVFCGGFIPVGGCAKGCGNAGRVATRSSDDVARLGVHSTGLTAAETAAISGSRYGDDLARSGAHYSDDLARTGDDLAHAADDVHVSTLASDIEQSGIKLSESQHSDVIDALETIGEEVVGHLADGDDSDDEADTARAAVKLEKRLEQTLTRQQLRKFHAEFGSSREVVERLAREQRSKRAAGSAQK